MKWYREWLLNPDGGAGAGASAGGEGAGGASGQDAATGAGDQAAADRNGRGAEKNAQGDKPGQTVPDKKERKAAFEKLIREDYADLFQEKTKSIIQKRMEGANAAKEQLGKLEPALKLLKQKYGTDDLDALAAAISNDDQYYEAEAAKRGMPVEMYKEVARRDETIARYQEQQREAEEQRERAQQVMAWRQQEAELKEIFPDFDLETEMELSGGELFQMLKNGVSLKTAYQALHMDGIMEGTIAGAVKRTAQRTVETIRANGMRPTENGAGKEPGKHVAADLSKLTPQKMRELERRAARGELITPDKIL